jgi:hypothetical protein
MAEAPTDWKVQVTVRKGAIVEYLTTLAELLVRERIYYTVAASSREEAISEARRLFLLHNNVPERYVRSYDPRRLPT